MAGCAPAIGELGAMKRPTSAASSEPPIMPPTRIFQNPPAPMRCSTGLPKKMSITNVSSRSMKSGSMKALVRSCHGSQPSARRGVSTRWWSSGKIVAPPKLMITQMTVNTIIAVMTPRSGLRPCHALPPE